MPDPIGLNTPVYKNSSPLSASDSVFAFVYTLASLCAFDSVKTHICIVFVADGVKAYVSKPSASDSVFAYITKSSASDCIICIFIWF